MTDQPSPFSKTAETKPKPEPMKPVSLLHFLRDKTIPAQKQLNAARRMPPPPLSQSELTDAVTLIGQSQDALVRLESLLAELSDGNSEIAKQVIAVSEAYLVKLQSDPTKSLRLDTGLGREGVWTLIRQVHAGARDSQDKKRGQIAARFVLWLGRLKGALSDDAFIELVTRTFPPSGRSKSGKPQELNLAALLASQLHRKGSRDTLLQVVSHFEARLAADAVTMQGQAAQIEQQKAEATRLRGEIESLQNQVRDLQQRVEEREANIASLSQDISDHRAVKRQTENQLRARLTGLLQDQLLPLIRDIHDSASMEPVRAHVILDRTDSAQNLIKKETTWLASSD